MQYGPHLGTMGSLTLYTAPKMARTVRPVQPFAEAKARMIDITNGAHDWHRQQHLCLMYEGLGLSAEEFYKAVGESWSTHNVSFFVGVDSTNQQSMAFVYTPGYKSVPSFIVNGQSPLVLRFKTKFPDSRRLHVDLTCLGNAYDNVISCLYFHLEYAEVTIERLKEATKTLSDSQLLEFKGKAECTTWKKRSETQHAFLRVYKTLIDMRSLSRDGKKNLFLNAFDEHPDVVPLDQLINVHHLNGVRLSDHDHGVVVKYSLKQLFQEPELLVQYGIVMVGANSTSGYGKTRFMKRLGLEWCKSYAIAHDIPKDRANVAFLATPDLLKDVDWDKVLLVILDEFHPYDGNQLSHISETIMKQLLCPSDVCTFRGLYKQVVIPRHVPRLITGNIPEGELTKPFTNWYGARVPYSAPLRRKAIHFHLEHPLCSSEWRRSSRTDQMLQVRERLGVAERMQTASIAIPDPPPQSLLARLTGSRNIQ